MMDYNFNMNSKVLVLFTDADGDKYTDLIEIIDRVQSEKYLPLKITSTYWQVPCSGDSMNFESVRTDEYKVENYDELMDRIKYIYSQDRVNELPYWN